MIVSVPTGCWRSIDRDRRYRPFSTGRSLVFSSSCFSAGAGDRAVELICFHIQAAWMRYRRLMWAKVLRMLSFFCCGLRFVLIRCRVIFTVA